MIAGILRPTAGTVRDRRATTCTRNPIAAKAQLGFIPDRPFVYDKLTGAEFLRFVAGAVRPGRPGGRAADRRAARAVRADALEGRADGVLQPRHAAEAHHLERADPPARGDRGGRADGRARPQERAACSRTSSAHFVEKGGTVLMSTHTLEVAEAMCDRVAIIQHGRLVASGTMAEMRQQTASGDAEPGGPVPQAHRRRRRAS